MYIIFCIYQEKIYFRYDIIDKFREFIRGCNIAEVLSKRVSAGIVFYRFRQNIPEFFLVHPGGPFYLYKDEGYWSIPKGVPEKDELLFDAAKREAYEETGIIHDYIETIPLGSIIQKGGKEVFAWGCHYTSNDDPVVRSNTFPLEWPPGSGITRNFPEIDEGKFFPYETAIKKIKPSQIPLLDRLMEKIKPK